MTIKRGQEDLVQLSFERVVGFVVVENNLESFY